MDARGRQLKIWKLPQPGPLYCTEAEAAGVESGSAVPRSAGERLAASYVNFLVITSYSIHYTKLYDQKQVVAAEVMVIPRSCS